MTEEKSTPRSFLIELVLKGLGIIWIKKLDK